MVSQRQRGEAVARLEEAFSDWPMPQQVAGQLSELIRTRKEHATAPAPTRTYAPHCLASLQEIPISCG